MESASQIHILEGSCAHVKTEDIHVLTHAACIASKRTRNESVCNRELTKRSRHCCLLPPRESASRTVGQPAKNTIGDIAISAILYRRLKGLDMIKRSKGSSFETSQASQWTTRSLTRTTSILDVLPTLRSGSPLVEEPKRLFGTLYSYRQSPSVIRRPMQCDRWSIPRRTSLRAIASPVRPQLSLTTAFPHCHGGFLEAKQRSWEHVFACAYMRARFFKIVGTRLFE